MPWLSTSHGERPSSDSSSSTIPSAKRKSPKTSDADADDDASRGRGVGRAPGRERDGADRRRLRPAEQPGDARRAARAGRGRSAPRPPGSHQLQWPNSFIAVGTSSERTIVTSIRIAAARAKPNCCSPTIDPATNPMNAANMIRPAAVTSRPVFSRPTTTASSFEAPVVPLLAHPADEEHLVVHREAEEHREQHHRDPALDLVVRDQAERLAPAPLEDDDEQPVRRADREAVEDDRLERQEQRAEGPHEQDVRGEQHREHEPREPAVGEVEEVLAARRAAAGDDGHARGEAGGRDDVAAQAIDEVEALRLAVVALADHLHVQVAARRIDVLGASRLEVDARHLRVGLEARAQPRHRGRDLGARRSTLPAGVDHDRVGAVAPAPTAAGEDVEALDGLEVLRDALVRARPELEREHRRGQQQEERGRPDRDRPRAPHDPAGERRPEAALVVGAAVEPAPSAAAAPGRACARRARAAPAGTSAPRSPRPSG